MANALETFGEAARACGTESFYRHLLDGLSPMLDWQCRAVVRYSRATVPVYLIDEGADPEVIDLYLRGYYRVDPYYAAFTKNEAVGMMVLSRDLCRQDTNPYIVVFAPTAKWSDEIGILLPGNDETAVGLFWEVIGRSFTPEEIAIAEQFHPLIAGINEQHVEKLRERQDAEEPVPAGGNDNPPRGPVTIDAAVASFVDVQDANAGLTPREREIVELSLAGKSNADIADELGIEIGSVKNHRGRLYKKLGITGERDLYRLFLDHISDMADVA
ncbi:MAG: LuxR C-terminal-related transcriptional regulator [Rhodospirillales bacterium]